MCGVVYFSDNRHSYISPRAAHNISSGECGKLKWFSLVLLGQSKLHHFANLSMFYSHLVYICNFADSD